MHDRVLKGQPLDVSVLLEHTNDFILISDGQGRPVLYNSAYAAMMKELLGLDMKPGLQPHTLLPPEQRAYWDELHARVLGGETFQADFTFSPPSGRTRHFEVSFSPIRRGDQVLGFTEVTREVTKWLRTQDALRQSEELYRTVYETAPLAFVVWDLDCRIVEWNRHAERVFGWSRAEVLGVNFFEMIIPEGARKTVEAVVAALKQGRVQETVINENLTKAGETILCEWNSSVLHDAQGRITGALSLALDITERRRAQDERLSLERQVQHAQKLESLGVLAGGIAHDFNNLLMGVMGNADMALMDLPAEHPATAKVRDILSSAVRAAELARQMLAYSGRGSFVVEPINLNRMVQEMSHLLSTVVSKKCEIHFELSEALPAVTVDPNQMRQVAMNLLTNASEAIGEGRGVIVFRTGIMEASETYLAETYLDEGLAPGRYVFLEVSDTGAGMDEETRARMFDPFFSTKFTGRGLGLSATLGIVRGHGGAVRVDSREGEGTTVRILLPRSTDRSRGARAPAPAVKAEPAVWRGQGTVLLVDDERGVREVGRSILERAGLRVMTAVDGRDGVERFERHASEIDLVILDMTMPIMGGEEVFHRLKAIAPAVRVLLSSGYNEAEATDRFTGLGLAGFIQKPYRAQALIDKLRQVLGPAE